jgi:hypothetical protein
MALMLRYIKPLKTRPSMKDKGGLGLLRNTKRIASYLC